MNIIEYQKLALHTESPISPDEDFEQRYRIHHACTGIATETLEALLATDNVNFREEIGDLFWYYAILCDALGVVPQEPQGILFPAGKDTILVQMLAILDTGKKLLFCGKPLTSELITTLHGQVYMLVSQFVNRLDNLSVVDSILTTNIAKLRKRYPEKFSAEKCENRDLAAERAILEYCRKEVKPINVTLE